MNVICIQESILSESEVWDESNSNILKFEPAPPKVQQDEDTLLSQYPIPQPSTINITKVTIVVTKKARGKGEGV